MASSTLRADEGDVGRRRRVAFEDQLATSKNFGHMVACAGSHQRRGRSWSPHACPPRHDVPTLLSPAPTRGRRPADQHVDRTTSHSPGERTSNFVQTLRHRPGVPAAAWRMRRKRRPGWCERHADCRSRDVSPRLSTRGSRASARLTCSPRQTGIITSTTPPAKVQTVGAEGYKFPVSSPWRLPHLTTRFELRPVYARLQIARSSSCGKGIRRGRTVSPWAGPARGRTAFRSVTQAIRVAGVRTRR